jgi:hypothetical protein
MIRLDFVSIVRIVALLCAGSSTEGSVIFGRLCSVEFNNKKRLETSLLRRKCARNAHR